MYTHFDNYGDIYRQNNKLIADLEKAIDGEYSAIICYGNLAQMAPTETDKLKIIEIQNDEKKHLQQFVQLYQNLTGIQPQPKISEKCPGNYMEGIELAFLDEQETVDFYLRIADETNNSYIKELLKRIAADEQNHAVWFLYLFTKAK